MGQEFKEVATIRTDKKKYNEGWNRIFGPKDYVITVRAITEVLDLDDQKEWCISPREVRITAKSEEKALDEFHATYPIAVLEDFEITIELENEDVSK